MKKKKPIHQDIYLCGIIYLVAFFFWYFGRNIKHEARVYPLIVLSLILFFNTLLLIITIKKSRKMTAEEIAEHNSVHWDEIRFPLFIFLVIAAYIVLFDLIGYFIPTAIMMVALMLILKVRNWKIIVFVPAGILALIYLLFVIVLKIPL